MGVRAGGENWPLAAHRVSGQFAVMDGAGGGGGGWDGKVELNSPPAVIAPQQLPLPWNRPNVMLITSAQQQQEGLATCCCTAVEVRLTGFHLADEDEKVGVERVREREEAIDGDEELQQAVAAVVNAARHLQRKSDKRRVFDSHVRPQK